MKDYEYIKDFKGFLNESRINESNALWSGNIYNDGVYASEDNFYSGAVKNEDFPEVKNPENVVYSLYTTGADGTNQGFLFYKDGTVQTWLEDVEPTPWEERPDLDWDPANPLSILETIKEDADDEDFDYSGIEKVLKPSTKRPLNVSQRLSKILNRPVGMWTEIKTVKNQNVSHGNFYKFDLAYKVFYPEDYNFLTIMMHPYADTDETGKIFTYVVKDNKTDFLILGYYEHDQEYLITSEKMIPLNNEKPLNFNSLTARINSLYESMK